MKRIKLLLFLLGLTVSTDVLAFTSLSPSGHTITYMTIWNTDSVYVTRQNYANGAPSYTDLAGDVIIPPSVTYGGQTYIVAYIGQYAFSQCKDMTSITLPSTIRSIESTAFNYCTGLTEITIPNSVKSIGDYAFSNCHNLVSITIPSSVKSIGNGAFNACFAALSISIPSTVGSIGSSAFWLVRNIVYQGSASGSPWGANSVNGYIENGLVYSNSQKTKILGCPTAATNVVIPTSVTSIGYNAFSFCSGIDSLLIPGSVNEIEGMAFYMCSNLHQITINNAVPPQISDNNVFSDTATIQRILYVPCQSTDAYSQNDIWSSVGTIEEKAMYKLYGISYGNGQVQVEQQTCGNNASIEAIPNDGYRFVSWHDGLTDNPRSLSLTSDTTLYAYFEEDNVIVRGISTDIAKGSVSPELTTIHRDSSLILYAVPKAGFVFTSWSNGNTDNPYHIIASADTTLLYAFFSNPDTTYLEIHDTTYIDVHDTAYIAIHDTIYNNVHDTTIVTDTMTITAYTTIYDTAYIDVPVHDTTVITDTVTLTEYVPIHDTAYINVQVHDTTVVIDTVTLIEYVPIHDTAYITVPVHDTTVVTDTVTLTEYVSIHDTAYITMIDTLTVTQYDTLTNTVFDTIINTVVDTLMLTDTLWLHDTIIIHDTVYITQDGVDDVDALTAKVYSNRGQIVVEGADGNTVALFDVNGRVLATKRDEYAPLRFDAPASGTYVIKIGSYPACKVVVIR